MFLFFIFSKILFFLLSPLVWIIALLSYSLFGANKKWKRRTLVYSLIISLFFSNSFILDEFMRIWEVPATKYENLKVYDYGILLGGMVSYDKENDRINSMRSIDRMIQTIKLYKLGKIKKIFISAGSGNLTYPDFKEGIYLRKYLISIGIPKCDIEIEIESLNTYQNAAYTAETLMPDCKNCSFLLITSATHMRRAQACFKKAGINSDTFSVDRYSGARKFNFDHLIVPNIETFSIWVVLIKEWVGYIVYSIVGYV